MQIIREEAFRATRVIYIEPLTSRPHPIFWESSENSREGKNVEQEIFEALKHVSIVGEGLEEILWGLRKHFSPPAPSFVIMNDYEEEE